MTALRLFRLAPRSIALLCALIAFSVFAGSKTPAHAQEPPGNVLEETQVQTQEAPADPPVETVGETFTAPPPASASLPHDLSPMGMYRSADIVGTSVMIGLVVASILTGTVFSPRALNVRV